MNLFFVIGIIFLFFLVFQFQQKNRGRQKTERIEKEGGSLLLSKSVMEFAYWLLNPLVKICVALKISPNFLSFFCLVLAIFAGIALARGDFTLGGWLYVFSSLADALDGMLARARNVASDAGEVLDAAVDRYTELFFCFGLLIFYRNNLTAMLLTMFALTGCVMVSYATAKAESLQTAVPRGFMRRSERSVYFSLAALLTPQLLFDPMQIVLLFVGVLGNYSAIKRLHYLYCALKKKC